MSKVLKLAGRELRCIEQLPPGLLFDLAEAMDTGGEMKAVAVMRRLLYTAVVDEEHEALQTILYDRVGPPSFTDLNKAIGELMTQYSEGRPLGRVSRSPSGGGTTGGTPRVVSLSRATEQADVQSRKAGKSAAS